MSLLDKVLELEKGLEIVSLPTRSPEKMQVFLELIQKQGVDTSKVTVLPIESLTSGNSDGNTEYGLFAKEDLTENQLILSIPQSVMMTAKAPGGGVLCSDIGFRKSFNHWSHKLLLKLLHFLLLRML